MAARANDDARNVARILLQRLPGNVARFGMETELSTLDSGRPPAEKLKERPAPAFLQPQVYGSDGHCVQDIAP